MGFKKNGVLFGALLIIVGVCILLSSTFKLNISYLPWLAIGASLLLLYCGKRKTWALALGVALVELSLDAALHGYGITFIKSHILLFFFIPGTVFLVLFLTKNMQGLLIPASVLLWTGFGITLRYLPFIPPKTPVLVICFGMALVTVYLLGNSLISKNYLYIGSIICMFGLYSFFKPFSFANAGKIGWWAVALLCVVLIIHARKGRKDKKDEGDGSIDG